MRHVLLIAGVAGLDGPLRLLITRVSVEVSFEIDNCLVRTLSGGLYIRLNHSLPNTVAAAAIGRPLRDLVEHRLLDDPSWRLLRIRPVGGGMWLVVQTGQVPFEMPWRDMCEVEGGEGRLRPRP